MTPEPVLRTAPVPGEPARRASSAWIAAGGTGAGFAIFGTAHAQGATEGKGFVEVLERLDGIAIALIAVALLVVLLLVWRTVAMVRREQPVSATLRRAQRDGDPLERATLQQATDWGFDQNKRGALARTPVEMKSAASDLPPLEQAVTQWSMKGVKKAGDFGIQPRDALGQSPIVGLPSPYRTSFNPYFDHDAPDTRVEVVEVADTLLQAELLVQLGDPKQAMTLLSHHIRETEKPGPAVWLMLLGLYQSTGREAQYNALSEGFRTLFNAEVPPWATTADALARDLESYPQALAKLQAAWSGPEPHTTIEALLNDDRGGSRQGFSLAAYRDLLFLAELLDTLDLLIRDNEERSGIRRKRGYVP